MRLRSPSTSSKFRVPDTLALPQSWRAEVLRTNKEEPEQSDISHRERQRERERESLAGGRLNLEKEVPRNFVPRK